ncbi:RING zinc finger-containing protein [Zostera marina]|uniref:RING zinc finger-containing protein n=1 Tax=Zostera marina TaxID=29655 RepID=A0A0K9PIJ3_ZOSMR|nr:RING zinc finger-containing protein [Zostera marina]
MVDEFMVCVDRLIASANFESSNGAVLSSTSAFPNRNGSCLFDGFSTQEGTVGSEGEVCVKKKKKVKVRVECRICQEDEEETDMEAPCACNGTLKFAHRKCIQKWCNKKGDITCEICNQVYAPDYSVPPAIRSSSDNYAVDISQTWANQVDLNGPRFLAFTSAEHEFITSEFEDYSTAHNNGIALCRSVALILMMLLLIRHAFSVTRHSTIGENATAFFNVSLFQFAGILLSCYVIVRTCYLFQNRRQRHQNYLRQIWG